MSEGGSEAEFGCGGVARWRLSAGVSCSPRRGGARVGLLRMGGGERSLGETGHLGDSLRCSWVVGDFTGALTVGSDVPGRRVGVVEDESILDAEDRVGLVGRADLAGLTSW